MKLFSVIYLKGHLAAAMFLWNGATMEDCRHINAQYVAMLPSTEAVKSGKLRLTDISLDCEWHSKSPIKNPG